MISRLQQKHLSSTSVNQQVITFDSNIAAESAIVITGGGSTSNFSISAVSDSLGNSYSQVKFQGNGNLTANIWMAVNSTAGANTVTIDWSGTNNPQTTIVEYAGVKKSSVATATDQTGGTTNSGATNHPCNSTNLTPSENNCLCIGCGRSNSSMTVSGVESGYTSLTGGSRFQVHEFIQITAAATDADFTTTAPFDTACAMAIIKSEPATVSALPFRTIVSARRY